MNLDAAFKIAENIILEAKQNMPQIVSEEDAKIQIITRILVEVLGWSHSDISAEKYHDNGFSDYILNMREMPSLLVEAKRLGLVEISTTEMNSVRHLKISGPGLKKATDGIDQAYSYAGPNGIPMAALTDGQAWIIFKPHIAGEHFKNKEAIVFPSLDAVTRDFALFFDLLSKEQIEKRVYAGIFDKVHQNRLLLSDKLMPPISKNEVDIVQKEDIAFDLDRVFEKYFSRLTGETDEQLLIECFVETRESRIADFSLEKLTSSILGNLMPSDKDVGEQLALLVSHTVDDDSDISEAGNTVFIVGPTGAGKTTFLTRFFSRTLPNSVRRRCAVLRINFLDATGTNESSLQWFTEKLISELEKNLYQNGSPSWDELQGLYHAEYQRRSTGVDAVLYQRSKQEFKEKFGEFLDDKVESDREGYLKRILTDSVARKKLPILVIDNTDEFSIEFKDKIFQFAQSLRRHVNHCLIFFPMTDKSAWAFSKSDIYSIYKSRSFYLPTPPPREVFRKRIDYLKKVIAGEDDASAKAEYVAGKGMRVSIDDISKFAKILEEVFVDHDYTSKTIGDVSNYNIRRTLALSQRIITSPVFKVGDLLKSYITGSPVAPSFAKFMNALLKGDYELYRAGDGNEIFPVFQADSEVRQSPLLNLRILCLLEASKIGSRNVDDKHMALSSIFAYFDALGCSEAAINRSLLAQMEAGLVEPYDVANRSLSRDQRLAITYKGSAHLRLATSNTVFFEQMALTTAIFDKEKANLIANTWKSSKHIVERTTEVRQLFLNYLLRDDELLISDEVEGDQFECQRSLLAQLARFGTSTQQEEDDQIAALGSEFQQGVLAERLEVGVDWFDMEKGFGFVTSDEPNLRAFVHLERAKEIGIDVISESDRFICDVVRKPKGPTVMKIHEIVSDETGTSIVKCKVVRLYDERGYGFANIENTNRDAFFRLSMVEAGEQDLLSVGNEFVAAVNADPKGRGWQIQRFVSFEKHAK